MNNNNNIKQDEGFIAIDKIVKVTFRRYSESEPLNTFRYEKDCVLKTGMLWWKKEERLGDLFMISMYSPFGRTERAVTPKEFSEKYSDYKLTDDCKVVRVYKPKVNISTADGITNPLYFDTDEQMRMYLNTLQNRFPKQDIIEI